MPPVLHASQHPKGLGGMRGAFKSAAPAGVLDASNDLCIKSFAKFIVKIHCMISGLLPYFAGIYATPQTPHRRRACRWDPRTSSRRVHPALPGPFSGVFFACQKSAVFSPALWAGFFAILGGFWCRNPPKMEPKVVRKRVFERTRCCSTFLHDCGMFCALFAINFLDAFLLGLLAFFPDFLYFLKTAEVHFGVTSSRILRSGRVSTRERFSKLFAKIRENRYVFFLQNL